jgi:uncharacterized damage-inducible protein DinB
MALHPLVPQLRFARSEFRRALVGISDAEAQQRILPMNCISWNIGHLAWQEQQSWLMRGQGKVLLPEVHEQFSYSAPPSQPALDAIWEFWHTITQATDPWLDTLTVADLDRRVEIDGKPSVYCFGSLMQRVIYHYWYHTGENMAIRQLLGHTELPEFVGDIDHEAPYRPELNIVEKKP